MGWIGIAVDVLLRLLKGIFGLDAPQDTTVDHPDPELDLEGKDHADLLDDLDL